MSKTDPHLNFGIFLEGLIIAPGDRTPIPGELYPAEWVNLNSNLILNSNPTIILARTVIMNFVSFKNYRPVAMTTEDIASKLAREHNLPHIELDPPGVGPE